MPGGLPPVLITNIESITEEIDNDERVQVEDVVRLWRVYTLNSAHVADDEGTRLENFFWRIWSNRSIIRSIRGSTLARLFITISDGGNRVRTTPVPTPLAGTPTQISSFLNAAPPQLAATQVTSETGEQSVASPDTVDTDVYPRGTSDQSRTLPPILKKSRTGSDHTPKSAEVSSPDTEERDPSTAVTHRQSPESSAAQFVPAEKGVKHAGKKKTNFAAGGGTRKARPGAPRKRSSQTSASGEQKKGSQPSPSPGAQPGKHIPKPAIGRPPVLTTPTFALPSSSWQDIDSPSSSRNSLDNTFSTSQQPSAWLVDKNFRGKFVEHQKRATSSINLAALGKSQSVRFLDEMPEYKNSAGRGTTRVEKFGGAESEMVGRPKESLPSAAPSVKGEEDDAEMPALPRTKSQLSMLIDKQRTYSGVTHLGPEHPGQANQPKKEDDREDDRENDDDEENELLLMARRDKKGKPKDPDQPFRAAAKKGFRIGRGSGLGGEGEEGSSPSPVF